MSVHEGSKYQEQIEDRRSHVELLSDATAEAPLAVYHQASVVPAAPAAPQNEWSRSRIDLLKRTYANGSTDDEFLLFIETCKRLDLSPEARQIFSVSRWDTQAGSNVRQTQVSIDGLRLIAERTGQYRGQTPIEWCGKDGVWKEIWTEDDFPFAARVGVIREGYAAPLYRTAKWSAFVQTKRGGLPNMMWATKGDHMLGKCAEANALRAAFPNETSGVYTVDEMGQASNEAPDREELNRRHEERKSNPPAQALAADPDETEIDPSPVIRFAGHPKNKQHMSVLDGLGCLKLYLALERLTPSPELAEYLPRVKAYAQEKGITTFTREEARRLMALQAAVNDGKSPAPVAPLVDEDFLHTTAWPDTMQTELETDIRKWKSAERLLEYGAWLTANPLGDKEARIARVEACLKRVVDAEQEAAEAALSRKVQDEIEKATQAEAG